MLKRNCLCAAGLIILGAACGGGSNGSNGSDGANGEAGAAGSPGASGTPGAAGDAGAPGAPGEAGATGSQGPAGEGGAVGPQGPQGDAGATGPAGEAGAGLPDPAAQYATATPIKHVIVVFGENVAFDHYFGTYPNAQNNTGETAFTAATGTPVANTEQTPLDVNNAFAAVTGSALLTSNPNSLTVDGGTVQTNPLRLASVSAETTSQGHGYAPEQKAYDNGHMDMFPVNTGSAESTALQSGTSAPAAAATKAVVMAYFDGNTLGTFWNLAQSYALNDNSYTTQFGPSSPGAINLISGQTNGVVISGGTSSNALADGTGSGFTLIGDVDPTGDTCSAATTGAMTGKNIGDLLNGAGVTWGWFQGGFDLTETNANGTTGCTRSSPQTATDSTTSGDYVQHHQPFQYYASTANPTHARPSSVEAIGHSTLSDGVGREPANHQYDTHDFFDALGVGNLAAVSYLKAPSFEDGHPGNSNPVDEQNFASRVVAAVKDSPFWGSTAIIFAYDDSDGWYDHQAPPIVNPSTSASDFITGTGTCGSVGFQQGKTILATPLLGVPPVEGGAPAPVQGRCGYGTRIPLMVVSPYSKKNFIDHTLTDQTSVLKFIEDNWLAGARVQPGGSFDTIAGSINNMFNFP